MMAATEEELAAARALLAEQAQTVTGDPAAAGIFGDPAGRSQPPQPIDLSAAKPTEVSDDAIEQMLALMAAQQEQINALLAAQEAAKPAPPGPPNVEPRIGNASGEVQEAFSYLHRRLLQLEAHLGIPAHGIFDEPDAEATEHGAN